MAAFNQAVWANQAVWGGILLTGMRAFAVAALLTASASAQTTDGARSAELKIGKLSKNRTVKDAFVTPLRGSKGPLIRRNPDPQRIKSPKLGLHGSAMPNYVDDQSKQQPDQTPAKAVPSSVGPSNVGPGVQSPITKPPTAKKDIWTPAQITAARRSCKKILRRHSAIVQFAEPIKKGACGSPAPVRLLQIGKSPVTFSPPPLINCQLVGALGKWLTGGLQSLAKQHLGDRIADVSVMSSYSCRNAYGRKHTRLSEHATANALDIRGFVTANGAQTYLLAHWGPTRRELIARKMIEQETVARKPLNNRHHPGKRPTGLANSYSAASLTPSSGRSSVPTTTASIIPRAMPSSSTDHSRSLREAIPAMGAGPPLPARRPSLKERMDWARKREPAQRSKIASQNQRRKQYRRSLDKFLYPGRYLGGPRSNIRRARSELGGPKGPRKKLASQVSKLDKSTFLKAAHISACKIFGTVLGPEANQAHRNHFHVDLAPRRHSNYCR